MSNCLCCGKPLKEKDGAFWHSACIKEFFGTSVMPDIDISETVLKQLAEDSTQKGYTVPGVQKKLSLHLSKEKEPLLTLVNFPTGYILKPQTEEYEHLPELEYLVMSMAKESGIKTVPFGLLYLPAQNSFAYITKRIDRAGGQTLAMEDFCQLGGRLTEDKYRGSYERCGKIIAVYSENVGLDLSELYLRLVFSFVVGNSDMHLKNFSLIETTEGSGRYVLSAAYDLLSTAVVLPNDPEELALTLNGKKQNIRRRDFFDFAGAVGIPENSAKKMMAKIVKLEEKYQEMCERSYLPEPMKEKMKALLKARLEILK